MLSNLFKNTMSSVNINGSNISITNGGNVSIVNGELFIDGVKTEYEGGVKGKTPVIYLTINGEVSNLSSDGSINCDDIKGNVTSGGSINCDDIVGDVKAGVSINCDRISGNATAGGSISM